MTPNPHWFRRMLAHMSFPEHYVVFDCETSGLTPTSDLVLQLGYCVVAGCKAVATGSMLLDWSRHPKIDQAWLEWRLAETKKQMEAKGKPCHMTYGRLRDEGVPPDTALAGFRGLLLDARGRGDPFLGHNAWGFDIPVVQSQYERFTGEPFVFAHEEVYDTGMLEKASQLGEFPLPGETRFAFYRRVHARRAKGLMWSLDAHCVPKYGLDKAHGLRRDEMHDAGLDCLVTHHLFETFRGMAHSPPPARNVA